MRFGNHFGSAMVLAIGLAVLGCETGDLAISTGPRAFSTRPGDDGARPSVLVGRWQRTVVTNGVSTETTWELRADGLALRTVVTKSLASATSDVAVTTGFWQTSNGVLIVTLTNPQSGTLQFAYSVFGNVLTLNGLEFVRIS